jgi:hypothetical protein
MPTTCLPKCDSEALLLTADRIYPKTPKKPSSSATTLSTIRLKTPPRQNTLPGKAFTSSRKKDENGVWSKQKVTA